MTAAAEPAAPPGPGVGIGARLARSPANMRIVIALVVVATIAMIGAVWALTPAAPPPASRLPQRAAQRVVPPTVVPPVEPIEYADVDPQTAREINEEVPFSKAANPAARPFILKSPELDRARAQDCLAAAMLYEAGSGDPDGQRAVAQVVMNRMRHPAFPSTICGVVFQGQERRTGCQFTFTCDGALARTPNLDAWAAARKRAGEMLDGAVYKPVGVSTHYHTDWVVPYWSSSLDKVTRVRTHLFFRWTGWWGTPPAFRGSHNGPEPAIAKIAALSQAHGAAAPGAIIATQEAEAMAASAIPTLQDGSGTHAVLIGRGMAGDAFFLMVSSVCGSRDFCKLMAWVDPRAMPKALPITDKQASTMAFSYLRDRANGFDKALWDCTVFKRGNPGQCMKTRVTLPAPPPRQTAAPPATPPPPTAAPPAATPPPVVPTR